jgi:formate dehydrogenase subunit gamma
MAKIKKTNKVEEVEIKPLSIEERIEDIERFRKPTRVLHWTHVCAFLTLFLTGLILWVPVFSLLAVGSWTRVIHRVAAVVFIVAPLIYLPLNWKASWEGIKSAFTWTSEDVQWWESTPLTYLFNKKLVLPPQEHLNSGQKLWWLMTIVFGIIFVSTGLITWAFKTTAPLALLQVAHIGHDLAFIATGVMLFVHIYLSAFAPLVVPGVTGLWCAMSQGKVTCEYARKSHSKWYKRALRMLSKEGL